MSETARAAAPTSPLRLVILVSVALFINYVDRGNLATAATLIQQELHLSATQLGLLLSAFFYTYVPAQPGIGWLSERVGAHRILAWGVAVWAIATLLTGFAGGFVSLLLLRLLLGLGESAGFPCVSKLVAVAVEPKRFGTANGVIAFAYLVGPAVGTWAGGLLMDARGWRSTFVLFGALSLLWLWPWRSVRVETRAPMASAAAGEAAPAFGTILRERGLWAAALGHFTSNYNWYFCLSWLPLYLIQSRGFSMKAMAGLLGFAYLINAGSGLLGGWICDAWIRAGRSANVIYKLVMAVNHLVSIAAMIGMALLPLHGSVLCLFVYEVVLGLSSPGIYAIPQIMAGPAATGRWVGVQNSCANIAGIFAPWITGLLVDSTHSFDSAFMLAALVNVLGVIAWVWMLPRVAPLPWSGSRR